MDLETYLQLVPRRFESGWDQLMRPISRLMTPRTFAVLLDQTATYLARVLAKRVWSYAGRTNAFGAVRMERDFSGIVGAVAKGNYRVREAFAKTSQLLMVANMEDDEWEAEQRHMGLKPVIQGFPYFARQDCELGDNRAASGSSVWKLWRQVTAI